MRLRRGYGAATATDLITRGTALWRSSAKQAAIQMMTNGATLDAGRSNDISSVRDYVTGFIMPTLPASDQNAMLYVGQTYPNAASSNSVWFLVSAGIADALSSYHGAQAASVSTSGRAGASRLGIPLATGPAVGIAIHPATGLPLGGGAVGPAAVSPATGLPMRTSPMGMVAPIGAVIPVPTPGVKGPIQNWFGPAGTSNAGPINPSTGLPTGGGGGGGTNYVDNSSSQLCWDGSAPEDNAGGVCTQDQSQWPIDPATGLPVNPNPSGAQPSSLTTQAQDDASRASLGIPVTTAPVQTNWNALLQTSSADGSGSPVSPPPPGPAKPGTGLGLAAAGGGTGFVVGGPLGAAVGALVGFLVGKPKAPVAPLGTQTMDDVVPVQYTAGGAPAADVSPQYYSPDDGAALAPPPGFPGAPDFGPTSPPPGFPMSTQYQTGGYSGWKRRRAR